MQALDLVLFEILRLFHNFFEFSHGFLFYFVNTAALYQLYSVSALFHRGEVPGCLHQLVDEQPAGLRPIGMDRCVRCAVFAHMDMGPGVSISAPRIFLIHQPDIALLVLDSLLIQPLVHFACGPAVILADLGNGEQVLAGKHHIIVPA